MLHCTMVKRVMYSYFTFVASTLNVKHVPLLWIPPHDLSTINTATNNALGLSWYLHVEWSTSTLIVGVMKPCGPLYPLFLIVHVFIQLKQCILRTLLYSLECSFKHQGLTSGKVLGQAIFNWKDHCGQKIVELWITHRNLRTIFISDWSQLQKFCWSNQNIQIWHKQQPSPALAFGSRAYS